MSSLIIRYFFIIFCSLYTYYKLLNIAIHSKSQYLISALIAFSISLLSSNPFTPKSTTRLVIASTLFLIMITFRTHTSLHISTIATTISFAVSLISLATSAFLISLPIIFFFKNASLISLLPLLSIGFLQFILIYLLFKIKRLQKGMTFLYHNSFISIGIILSLFVILIFFTIQYISPASIPNYLLLLLFILLLALALLIWWRRKITQSYVEKLRVSEVEALYKEISDKEHEIEKLHSNNRYLARIIHKDNKLIPAMELAVRNYLQNGMQMKPEDARQYGIDLLAQLQTMAADREGIIQNYHDDYRFRPQIGLYSVDAIIYYMERRAIPHSIRYEYQFDKGLKEVMLSYIDENDAIHLLSDAIENSIIATMHAIKKEIKIHIGFIQDILFMDISDTGLPFEPATYQNFGLLQHTTHKDSGGSGVGLLDIWKLKHKYKISLQIYEYPPDDHEYTKKIRFFFDRRNHFLIQSYRSQEITSLITRSDLHVFPYVEGSDFILTLDEEITEETE